MELVTMKPDADRYDAKVTVLIENVRHHIEEEEQEWFPKVRECRGRRAWMSRCPRSPRASPRLVNAYATSSSPTVATTSSTPPSSW
jgi:hypothetical protein